MSAQTASLFDDLVSGAVAVDDIDTISRHLHNEGCGWMDEHEPVGDGFAVRRMPWERLTEEQRERHRTEARQWLHQTSFARAFAGLQRDVAKLQQQVRDLAEGLRS